MDTNEKGLRLQSDIERQLPEFAKAVRNGKADAVVMHQDAFAADYQDQEFVLLGKAVKYAGIFGRDLHFVGRNRDTLRPEK